ncbi:MAG TPA: cysteine dioxygenase family protein [Thermomicrobiales bacterium]|nr:cysteine dioxygenase family protein [Thermomicrobiales bacterium]
MTKASKYAVSDFVADAQAIMSRPGASREEIVAELTPLVERIVWNDDLLDTRFRAEPESGRARFVHHLAEDGSLQVYVVEFDPGMPTPVHDHVTWGLIGVCGGSQATLRYRRLDDLSDPDHATLGLIEDAVLERGAVYPLLPPHDIHRIATHGDEPSYSLHVLGADLALQTRRIFDPGTGRIETVHGRGM